MAKSMFCKIDDVIRIAAGAHSNTEAFIVTCLKDFDLSEVYRNYKNSSLKGGSHRKVIEFLKYLRDEGYIEDFTIRTFEISGELEDSVADADGYEWDSPSITKF